MTQRLVILALIGCLAGAAGPAAPEPPGYRLEGYQAPTPSTLSGGRVLSTTEAFALWQDHGAAFVDVLPQVPRPAGLPPGTVWRAKPRLDIPGSLWLPDTGYGELAPVVQDYFERGLRQATNGDRARPLVIYCRDTCWHSWNAAKRALALGYTRVAWYREGTDGWAEAGHPLEPREAEPRPDAMLPADARRSVQ
jgi:PQQ-dependent catabolism-associated CXXCW motif protein